LKFLSLKGNPYIATGPSGERYCFFTMPEKAVDITHVLDIKWAETNSTDTGIYPQTLVSLESYESHHIAEVTRTNIYDIVERTLPCVNETKPLEMKPEDEKPLLVSTKEFEVSDLTVTIPLESNEQDESKTTIELSGSPWFEELSPVDLELSVRKLTIKIKEFLTLNLLADLESKKEYVRELISTDSRITLVREVEELFEALEE